VYHMDKILITGTGRCGTTFLIKLFSFLEFDTGFDKDTYKNFIFQVCKSGMEKPYNSKFYIVKAPSFMANIDTIVKDKSIRIKTVIVPLRDFKSAALSRVKLEKRNGGLWNATDEASQIEYYKDILTNYICVATKHDINTIFIDFDTMITDKRYLFNKLKCILDEKQIDFETFSTTYDDVALTCKQ